MLVKFEQNRMAETTQYLEHLIEKYVFLTIFDKALTPFLEDVSVAETIFNAKVLIYRLPSLSVPNITVVRHV